MNCVKKWEFNWQWRRLNENHKNQLSPVEWIENILVLLEAIYACTDVWITIFYLFTLSAVFIYISSIWDIKLSKHLSAMHHCMEKLCEKWSYTKCLADYCHYMLFFNPNIVVVCLFWLSEFDGNKLYELQSFREKKTLSSWRQPLQCMPRMTHISCNWDGTTPLPHMHTLLKSMENFFSFASPEMP